MSGAVSTPYEPAESCRWCGVDAWSRFDSVFGDGFGEHHVFACDDHALEATAWVMALTTWGLAEKAERKFLDGVRQVALRAWEEAHPRPKLPPLAPEPPPRFLPPGMTG